MFKKSLGELCQILQTTDILFLVLLWLIFPFLFVFWTLVGILQLIIHVLILMLGWILTPFWLTYRALRE